MTPLPTEAPDGAHAGRALHAFIVEDSALILQNLTAALEELEPARIRVVGHAADETTAVSRLGRPGFHVELIIIDIFLKQGSGLGVLSMAVKEGLQAHCIVVTNYATRDLRQRCQEMGAQRVFDKSAELDALLDYCAGLAHSFSPPIVKCVVRGGQVYGIKPFLSA